MITKTEEDYIYGKEHCMMMIDEGINDEVDTIVLEPRSIYDESIIGFTDQGSAVYSVGKIIGALINDGASEEDARDHLDYNIFGVFSSKPIIEELTDKGKEKNVANPIFVNQ